MMWGGTYHHCKLLIPQQCGQSPAARTGLRFLSVWLMRHTNASLCAAGLDLGGFFFGCRAVMCAPEWHWTLHKLTNWEPSAPRQFMMHTLLWVCCHVCLSLSAVHTQGQLSLVCMNSLSTNTSLTDPLFSKRSFSKAPRCCAQIRFDECSPTVSLYESSQFYFRGQKSQAHRLGRQSVTTVLRPSDA